MNSHPEYLWHPPQYDISTPPVLDSLMQLEGDPQHTENFVRTAKWCPDGSAFLTQNEDRTFQLFTTPAPTAKSTEGNSQPAITLPVKVLPQSAAILDFIWYPTASSGDAASFCFVASVRECPVKLLDASDGRLRASYRIVDHRERHIAPHSLAFNPSAERLYCGFEDAIEIFDVARPGEGTRMPTTPSKKSKDGLKGIISALAFVPSQGSDTFAVGSLNPTPSNIVIFSESQSEPVTFISGGPSLSVTQVLFNPTQPHMMYVAYRRHERIYSWDLRSNTSIPVKIFNCGQSSGRTNQKLRFDVDLGGNWLGSGDQFGRISLFDLHAVDDDSSYTSGDGAWTEAQAFPPTSTFEAHKDAIGSIAFHPTRSTLLSASGSRHFETQNDSTDLSDSDSSGIDDSDFGPENVSQRSMGIKRTRPHPVSVDSSVKIWAFAGKEASFQLKD